MEKYFGDFIPWCTFVARGSRSIKEAVSLFEQRFKDGGIFTNDEFLGIIAECENNMICGQKYSIGFTPTKGTSGSDCLRFIIDNGYLLVNTNTFVSLSVNLEDFIKSRKSHTSVFCIDSEDKLPTYLDEEFSLEERKQIPVLCKRPWRMDYFLGEYNEINFHENYILCIKKV